MSLLQLGQSQFALTKHPNILAAGKLLRPWLKSPILQVVISFFLGYYATTKISNILKKENDKRHSKLATNDKDSHVVSISEPQALRLTLQELRNYTGKHDDQPMYTALNGIIYDLTPLRKKPGTLAWFAGANANQIIQLSIDYVNASGECESIDDCTEKWEQYLSAQFNVVGQVIESDASESDESTNVNLTAENVESQK